MEYKFYGWETASVKTISSTYAEYLKSEVR